MLETERSYYVEHLPELLREHRGRFVLIKHDVLVGLYDTLEDALAEGARRFGGESFLARRVEEQQEEVSIPALTLGLLSANPSHTIFGPDQKARR
jgi:hypothetical protein